MQHIFSGAGAPSSTPTGIGHHYIDTTNGKSYTSVGTSSSADWKLSAVPTLATVATSGSHTDLSSIGTNTHAQIDTHIANTSNPHSVTKAQVGLSNVDNTSDVNKPVSTAQGAADTAVQNYAVQRANHTGTQTASTISDFDSAADARITAQKGIAGGIVPLDGSAKIASTYLPAYVDDVLEYANLASFPVSGTSGIIYVDLATNKTYRWSGSAYVEISASPGTTDALTEGAINLYFTVARVLATVLTGFSTGANTAIAATDTILQAFQKAQGQVTAAFARANHTGTQLASTISDFASQVIAQVLTGFTVGANTALAATDTILQAFEKIQAQLNNKNPLILTTQITASNTNTALVATSATYQQIIGSTNGQRITLPDATTMAIGDTFYIVNQSPTLVPVFQNGGTLVEIVYPYQYLEVELIDNSSAAGTWFDELSFPGYAAHQVFTDDFLSANTTSGNIGNLGWVFQGTGAAVAYQSGTNQRTGVARFSCGTGNNANASMNLGTTQGFILGGGALVYEAYVSVPTLGGTGAAAYTAYIGLMDTTGTGDNANGVYFEYAGTAGGTINWNCKTASASTRTTTGSGVALAAGTWYKLTIVVNDAGTSVAFYINGTFITAISTNIPTTGIAPAFRIVAGATNAAAKSVDVDYTNIYKTITVVR